MGPVRHSPATLEEITMIQSPDATGLQQVVVRPVSTIEMSAQPPVSVPHVELLLSSTNPPSVIGIQIDGVAGDWPPSAPVSATQESNTAVCKEEVAVDEAMVNAVRGPTQRRLLCAVNGKGRVPLADVLMAVYGTRDQGNTDSLLKAKTRVNQVLAANNAKCELRSKGGNLFLSNI
jgi:hypothetical protein